MVATEEPGGKSRWQIPEGANRHMSGGILETPKPSTGAVVSRREHGRRPKDSLIADNTRRSDCVVLSELLPLRGAHPACDSRTSAESTGSRNLE